MLFAKIEDSEVQGQLNKLEATKILNEADNKVPEPQKETIEFDDFTNIKRAKNGRTIWKDNVFLPRGSARPLQVKEAFPELLFHRNYKEEYYDAMFSMFANPPSNLNIKSPGNINPAIFTVAHYNNMSPKKQKDLMILGYIFASQNPDAVIKQETELISDASIRAMEIEKAQGKTIYEVCEDSEAGG